MTGEFPAHRASNAENVHHDRHKLATKIIKIPHRYLYGQFIIYLELDVNRLQMINCFRSRTAFIEKLPLLARNLKDYPRGMTGVVEALQLLS